MMAIAAGKKDLGRGATMRAQELRRSLFGMQICTGEIMMRLLKQSLRYGFGCVLMVGIVMFSTLGIGQLTTKAPWFDERARGLPTMKYVLWRAPDFFFLASQSTIFLR